MWEGSDAKNDASEKEGSFPLGGAATGQHKQGLLFPRLACCDFTYEGEVMIERSRVDNRWCVYSKTMEMLCPWWAIPVALLILFFDWLGHVIKIEPMEYDSKYFYITSGKEESPGCRLIIAIFRKWITIRLPQLIKPYREWVDLTKYEWAKSKGYWETHARQYGFSFFEDCLFLYFGRQTDDSSTTQHKTVSLPWKQWRHVRFSLYDLTGKHFWTRLDWTKKEAPYSVRYEVQRQAEDRVPKAKFRFKDFDGEEITATTHIQEREWHRGEGWFKWLSWFYKPFIRRGLDIEFSSEVGPRKGSWKGGTLGHGIDMLPGELHEAAFLRYCQEYNLSFMGRIDAN